MNWDVILKGLLSTVVFSVVGMVVFTAGFGLLRVILPMDVKKEIEHDQNVALGIIIGAFTLGLAFIIGMALHG